MIGLFGVDLLVIKGFAKIEVRGGPAFGYEVSRRCNCQSEQHGATVCLEAGRWGYSIVVHDGGNQNLIIKTSGMRELKKSSSSVADIQPLIPPHAVVQMIIEPTTNEPW